MFVSGGLPVNIYRGNSRRDKLLRYRFNLARNVFAQHQNLHFYVNLKTRPDKNRYRYIFKYSSVSITGF
jgi:hypothetical protein